MHTSTWIESYRFLEAHPELLTKRADRILTKLSKEKRNTEDVRHLLWEHQTLLRRCRKEGVAAAYHERLIDQTSISTPLQQRNSPLEYKTDDQVRPPPGFRRDIEQLNELNEEIRHNPQLQHERIVLMEKIVDRLTSGQYPDFEAVVWHNLGVAYLNLPTDIPEDNLERAIACFRQALHFRASVPLKYAETQIALGCAYENLRTGHSTANLEQAIRCYEESLDIYDSNVNPLLYATALNNLGSAYSKIPTGNRVENLNRAIRYCEEALYFRKPEIDPLGYADTQNNLGNIYLELPTSDRVENLPSLSFAPAWLAWAQAAGADCARAPELPAASCAPAPRLRPDARAPRPRRAPVRRARLYARPCAAP
jgi:tetratricopeptide (TPR) repeat protein